MSETYWIEKGTRVRASWLVAKPVALAGVQMKLGAASKSVVGTVVGVYGDAAKTEDCKRIWYSVQSDDGGEPVEVEQKWLKEVLS